MKNLTRYTLAALFLTSASACLSGGLQQYTSSPSFLTVAELLFGGALLLLSDGLGLLFDRAWVTSAWGGTLLYFVAATFDVYVIPEVHSGGRWDLLLPFLVVPLVAGLVLLRLLPLILRGRPRT